MNKARQRAFGSPAAQSGDTGKIEIDGLAVTGKAGTSILRAARESGVDVRGLCATDSVKPFGSCRLRLVEVEGRKGGITLRATITERVKPGVTCTTFHNPETGAIVVTTDFSDWATRCPEYKATAVQVTPATHRSEWQHTFEERAKRRGRLLETI